MTILIILWYVWYDMPKIIVSNIRFPEDEWIELKAAAYSMGMSANEYIRYLNQVDSARSMTGVKKRRARKLKGYDALRGLIGIASRARGKPMGASEEDKIIYGIE